MNSVKMAHKFSSIKNVYTVKGSVMHIFGAAKVKTELRHLSGLAMSIRGIKSHGNR